MGRFGLYRWALACLVAYSHLGPFEQSACGYYAVFGFFTLSGYLLTLVLDRHYLLKPGGARHYLVNRALRIYPPYFLCAFFAFALILLLPQSSQEVHGRMLMPQGWQWAPNLLILGMALPQGALVPNALLPPSWSLSTELFFYLLLPLALRQSYLYKCWVGFSILIWLSFIYDGQNMMTRYFSLPAGSMPFAVGSALYFIRRKLRPVPHTVGIGALLGTLLGSAFSSSLFASPLEGGFYIIYPLNVLAIWYLAGLRGLGNRLDRLDALAGNLAYPIFLLHIPAAVLAHAALGTAPKSPSLFLVSLPLFHFGAWLVHRSFETRLEHLRGAIRGEVSPVETLSRP